MNTTHDDNATTWRDLKDQLTADQIDGLAGMEHTLIESGVGDHPSTSAGLLGYARDYAERNLVDAAFSDVPLPMGATADSESWGKDLREGGYRRSLEWATFGDPHEANVGINGWQKTDGSFTRFIGLWGVAEGAELTGAQARNVAALLIEATDALDRLQ